jgi:hypothetical protein
MNEKRGYIGANRERKERRKKEGTRGIKGKKK